MAVLSLIFLDQIYTKWIKIDQIGFDLSKMDQTQFSTKKQRRYRFLETLPAVRQAASELKKLSHFRSNLSKVDQSSLNWI